ncbi:type VI secretion system Vgr family protein [Marinicellulosiphila megalodicopiae]|uniref:type VI secretion system Vgr family protein n=1 Tax=Marinicellulosiphila megalodicopiae TaxID=2724896 RepID=UPI003BB159C1
MSYFSDLDQKRFSFESLSSGVNKNSFAVINFEGFEALSKTYQFDILLVSKEKNIQLDDVIQNPVVFKIHRGDEDDVLFNGILQDFEQLHEFNDHIYYRAKLVPKLWWSNLTTHNQVFLKQSVTDLVELALQDADLESQDYEFSNLINTYEQNPYVCQYSESHFQFVSRWLEREGIYYHFEQNEDGEVVVFNDDCSTHSKLKISGDLVYQPATGLESSHLAETIYSLTCRQKQLPREVILKDYDYERPSLDVSGIAVVDPNGRGVSHIYGHYFKTPEEGDRLANIFAQQMLSEKQKFYGESTVPYMSPGYTFNLTKHFSEHYNQEYLITEINHKGSQAGCLNPSVIGGLDKSAFSIDDQVAYQNTFTAIPAITQFRPEKITERPRISGTLHAKIDAEGEGEYAEMDDHGRYKVRLPFDVNDQNLSGRASTFIRMMQPYAGENKGMQFPLTKGTEVMLTFTDGHPDRPLIAGAVNNFETPGPVNANNQSESVIQTGSGNKIRMEDKFGSERVMIESPASNSWLRIGSTNDPITLNGDSPQYLKVGETYVDPQATALDSTTDSENPTASSAFNAVEIRNEAGSIVTSVDTSSPGVFYLKYINENNTADTAFRKVVVGSNDLYGTVSDGIRIQSAGDVWIQARGKYGEYSQGTPLASSMPSDLQTLRNYFGGSSGKYKPTGLLNYSTNAAVTGSSSVEIDNVISNARVQLSTLDTVNTQEGNIYDFGGYWNYNLGNSYAEDHTNQSAVLNVKQAEDLLNIGGPTWDSVNWPTAGGKLSTTDTQLEGTHWSANQDSTNGSKVWVQKKWGHDYEFHVGDAINFQIGQTLDIIQTPLQVAIELDSSGKIAKWTKGSPGNGNCYEKQWNAQGTKIYDLTTNQTNTFTSSDEKKYDCNTGGLYHHALEQGTGMGMAKFEFDYSNTVSMTVNSGLLINTETFLGLHINNENYVGGKISMENSVGAILGMEFALGGIISIENAEIKTNIGPLAAKFTSVKMDTDLTVNSQAVTAIKTVATNIETAATAALVSALIYMIM